MTKAVFLASLIDSGTNGNLGIGTNVVASSGNSTVVVAGLGTNGGGIQLVGGGAGGMAIEGLNGGGVLFDSYTGAIGSETYTERMRIDLNGRLGVGMSPWGGTSPPRMSIYGTSTGALDYNCIMLSGENTTNNTMKGGVVTNARYAIAAEPFSVVGGYDTGIAREVYLGGGAWNIPDATSLQFFTAPSYSETQDTGVLRMQIDTNGNVGIGNTTVLTGYVLDVKGNINASGSIASTADSTQVATTGWVRDQGGFQSMTVLTTGTAQSWAVPAGINKIKVTVVGGGGAGGGSTAVAGYVGSGGGSGGTGIKYYTGVSGLTATYTVGGGGTGASGAVGGNGTASTFALNAITVTANGGTGGNPGNAAASITGGAGATAGSNGDINLPGSAGYPSEYSATAAVAVSGSGAQGFMGAGGASGIIKSTAGNQVGGAAAANTGAGGSGSSSGAATATAGTGGAGGSGVIIIEY